MLISSSFSTFHCTFLIMLRSFCRLPPQFHVMRHTIQIIPSTEKFCMTSQTVPCQIIYTIFPSLKHLSSANPILLVFIQVPSFVYIIAFIWSFWALMLLRLPTNIAVESSWGYWIINLATMIELIEIRRLTRYHMSAFVSLHSPICSNTLFLKKLLIF